jgi:carbamoyltransferase
MNILGIISVEVAGNPAACLLKDGKLVAFAEEERFVRVKQARGYFPSRAIQYCLDEGEITLENIDYIAYGWDSNLYKFKFPVYLATNFIKHKLFRRHKSHLNYLESKSSDIGSAALSGIKSLICYHPKNVKENIVLGLREIGYIGKRIPPIIFVKHHLAHAATAYYCSGFDESAVLTADGHGEENTIVISHGKGDQVNILKEINIPNSLGWFYSMFTEFLGFDPNEGEVKLMGLTPYGKENDSVKSIIDEILVITSEGISLNTDYTFYNKRSYGKFFSDLLVQQLGHPRGKNEEITQFHKDIAFAVQVRLQEAVIHLSKMALRMTGSKNLCLAGGVALNCKMNGELHKAGIAERIFVQPVSHDAGAALGAAMVVAMDKGDNCRFKMEHLYFGPEYTEEQIEKVLKRNRISYRKSNNIAFEGAKKMADGEIIGWFQGRMECGPRALGGRSILADPRRKEMKDRVNDLVKFRENWRPFAFSIQEEYITEYLKKPTVAPFMIMAFDVADNKINDIQGAMHLVDNTTRPHTVNKKINPLYWQLIEEFREITGVPGILNTSFNVKGEPIVCSPEDALRCFYGTGMDVLIIGNFIIEK